VYAKVFRQIFDSSLAEDYQTRHVFMDCLVLAERDGTLDMTLPAFARRAKVPLAVCKRAFEKLCQPDPESRSKEAEGRRLVLLDPERTWGWRIVNFEVYDKIRDEEARRVYMRTYMRKRRSKDTECEQDVNSCKQPLTGREQPLTMLAPTDTDTDTDTDTKRTLADSAKQKPSPPACSFREVMDWWRGLAARHGLPSLRGTTLGKARKEKLSMRWKEWLADPGDPWALLWDVAAAVDKSRFLREGGIGSNWRLNFGWLVQNDTNWRKVVEGNFEDKPDTADTDNAAIAREAEEILRKQRERHQAAR